MAPCLERENEGKLIDAEVLFLLAFASFGTATGVYFFNDKLEQMLNQERLPPLRWLSAALVLSAGVLLALGLYATT